MLELDFAFINMLSHDKEGLVYKESFLNRLAPFFFAPRLQRLFKVEELNAQGCNIVLPLGPGNIAVMNPQYKTQVVETTSSYVSDYMLSALAVDRRLRSYFSASEHDYRIVFGDLFILALAYVLIDAWVARYDLDRVVLAGELNDCSDFLAAVCMLGVPVSIQNFHPTRYELLAYHLLYEKGLVLNTSYFNPYQFEKKDLVVYFDAGLYKMAVSIPQPFTIRLTDGSENLAPQIEQELRRHQLDFHLHHLAPILETGLLAKAGYFSLDEEENKAQESEGIDFLYLQKLGHQSGLWELFLDKVM